MRSILILAAFIAGLGTMMAQMADKMAAAKANTPSPQNASVQNAVSASNDPAPAAATSSYGAHNVQVPRDARGRFQTDGRVNGQRLDFMVDTGASIVALNESSAARFGLRPYRSDYKSPVSTANGIVNGARTTLAMVDIGGLVVRDVDAIVLPDTALSQNLLGLSFLSKLKRFEYANGTMVLEQ